MGVKWEKIIWKGTLITDKRNYSMVITIGKTKWEVYDWDTKDTKEKWFISGNGSEKELENAKTILENLKLEMHEKDPRNVIEKVEEKKVKNEKVKKEKVEKRENKKKEIEQKVEVYSENE